MPPAAVPLVTGAPGFPAPIPIDTGTKPKGMHVSELKRRRRKRRRRRRRRRRRQKKMRRCQINSKKKFLN